MSLTGKNILRRRQSNNPRGSFTFLYSIKDKDRLK